MNNGEKKRSYVTVWCVANPNLLKFGCFEGTRCYFCVVEIVGMELD